MFGVAGGRRGHASVFAVRNGIPRAEFRLLGNDVDKSPGRVLAKQRALRTFENLDVGDVEKLYIGQINPRYWNVIDNEADAAFKPDAQTGRTDAANGENRYSRLAETAARIYIESRHNRPKRHHIR